MKVFIKHHRLILNVLYFNKYNINSEYRTIISNNELLSQNGICDGVVFILKGNIQVIMEQNATVLGTEDYIIGELSYRNVFGHIDFLFRSPSSPFMDEIRDLIKADSMKGSNDYNGSGLVGDDVSFVAGLVTGTGGIGPGLGRVLKTPMANEGGLSGETGGIVWYCRYVHKNC